ncbi:MAG: encapsulin [Thermoplasmatota archaeon]
MTQAQTLADLLSADKRTWQDAQLTPEAYRSVLQGAIDIFHEASLRPAFPVEVVNDPGVLKSRALKVVDLGSARHGMSGTGGTYDRVDYSPDDVLAYAIWENIEVPWREELASKRNGYVDILGDSGRMAGQLVVEQENAMLSTSLGPITGLTGKAGQTFAGATWATQGNAWNDITTARGKLRAKKVPGLEQNLALLVNPNQEAQLLRTFSNTAITQLSELKQLLPGGIYVNTNVTAGKAYVYARNPNVLRYRVFQDLTVVPLPQVDEDARVRVRTIGAPHFTRTEGICEVTGVA